MNDEFILDIKQIQNKYLYCRESILATICEFYKKDYRVMFSGLWTFDFSSDKSNKVGSCIKVGPFYLEDKLKRYYGISVIYNEYQNKELYFDFIVDEIRRGSPVTVKMNCKYWPWSNENDRKHEYLFPFLVVGFDMRKDIVYLLDIHVNKNINQIPIKSFLEGLICSAGVESYKIAENGGELPSFSQLLKKDIKAIFGSLYYDSSFAAMRAFTHALSYGVRFDTECETGEEFLESDLYLNITDICRSREMYSLFLKYIGEKYNHMLLGIADELSCIATDWISLRNLILKTYFRREKVVEGKRLHEMATQILIREEKLALFLKDIITLNASNAIMPKITAKQLSKISHITYVDLELFLNNKGIVNKSEVRKYADLSGLGEYILPVSEQVPPILEHEGMKFQIYWEKYINDNIVCLGQTISIPVGRYEGIMIAGTATWGNCNTDIILNYKCSNSERLRISIPDWQFGKMPDESKDVIWYGLGEKRVNDNFEPLVERYIYAMKYFIKREELVSVTLPDCPNLHIFGLSLEE